MIGVGQIELAWIDNQRQRMTELVSQWCAVNTWSHNLTGLDQFRGMLANAFGALGGQMRQVPADRLQTVDENGDLIDRPIGAALSILGPRSAATARRVLLCIHMDTVHRPDSAFQTVSRVDEDTLRGPGVADAKGGLVVMLIALEALQRSSRAEGVAWEVLINADEEIGSPGSAGLLAQCAARNDVGLVFEPSLPDGALISERKGSGNFTVVVRGKSAHVGRHPEDGRNAIETMADVIVRLRDLGRQNEGWLVNVGQVHGGGPVNIVPDLAICRFNVRVADDEQQRAVLVQIDQIIAESNKRDGIEVELHGRMTSPPKPLDDATQRLLNLAAACGRKLGLDVTWRPSGGVCDGNKLAAAGLATLDTLGPRGGGLHSHDEYLLLPSLTERAKLTALLLMELAAAERCERDHEKAPACP